MQWCALTITGMSLQYLIFSNGTLTDTLITLAMAAFMWLFAKLTSFAMKMPPSAFKFLNTRRKRIIAAVISFAMGFLIGFNVPPVT